MSSQRVRRLALAAVLAGLAALALRGSAREAGAEFSARAGLEPRDLARIASAPAEVASPESGSRERGPKGARLEFRRIAPAPELEAERARAERELERARALRRAPDSAAAAAQGSAHGRWAPRASPRAASRADPSQGDPGAGGPRSAAIAAYRAVAREHADLASLAAEAAFRAGELARADLDAAGARADFARAAELGRETPLEDRARLENAHLDRRAGDHEAALSGYLELLGATSDARSADGARYWAGRSCAALGRLAEARAHFATAASEARDPVERVRAFDAWMAAWIEEGDLEAAAGVGLRAHVELAGPLAEETESGRRTRRAFERMRSPPELRERVRDRYRAGR